MALITVDRACQIDTFIERCRLLERLQLLLCIYVYFSPEIGYVQGEAFLGAIFLLNLDLFDSFVCLTNLLDRRYFQSFYRFKDMDQYLQLLCDLIDVHLPRLSAHFNRMAVQPNCFALDWFYTVFAKSLPLDIVVRLWDIFFRDGESLIFRTALAILSLYQEELCQWDSFYCLQFLTRLPDPFDGHELFRMIEKIELRPTDSQLFHLIA
jgi:TBC1 domain family member 14